MKPQSTRAMRALILCLGGSCLALGAAQAAPSLPMLSGLPGADPAAVAIEQDPLVVQARHSAQAAVHGAAMLRQGSHEWTLGSNLQRRRSDGGGSANEWSAQLERSVRIGGKAELDHRLGQTGEALAQAQLALARSEAAQRLLDAWMDWRGAQLSQQLMAEQLRLAEANLRAVSLRHTAGDAARLELRLADADVAEMRRQLSAAQSASARAEAALRHRYPGLPLQVDDALPEPSALLVSADATLSHGPIIASHPRLAVATLALVQARLAAERVSADRVPDPTLGVFTASEAAGRERVIGISLSIPLSGRYRTQAAQQALQQVEIAQAELDRQQRELTLTLATLAQDGIGSAERWLQARSAAQSLSDTAALTHKGYGAGEGNVHALLMVRRQALEALSTEQAARLEALRSRYRLLIEAGQLWRSPTQ